MRALILAPHHPNLPDVAAEAATVANAHIGSVLLQGKITERDLAQAVAPGGFELLWICTHGNRDGVLLSDDHLDAGKLITYISASGANTVMLNTCESIHLAAQIVDSTPASVVATIADLPDAQAAATGALFAAQLAHTKDPRKAYERSKPGHNRTYVYLANANAQTAAATTPRRKPPSKSAPKAAAPADPPKKRGGQPGNQNASKTGYYSKLITDLELRDLETMMTDGIDDEIHIMRVQTRRLMELADKEDPSYQMAADLLDKLSQSSTTLATLLRTKKMISPHSSNDTARAIGEALTAVARELQLC